ncbi:hypothetical protein MTO96_051779 [Rhipicephalus appendiculatus]
MASPGADPVGIAASAADCNADAVLRLSDSGATVEALVTTNAADCVTTGTGSSTLASLNAVSVVGIVPTHVGSNVACKLGVAETLPALLVVGVCMQLRNAAG